MGTIVACLVLLMVIGGIGLGIYAIHAISSSKKEEKSISEPDKGLYGPYEKLWKDAGCTFLDFPSDIVGRWTEMEIKSSLGLETKETYEDIYHDALLNLIKEGDKCKQLYEDSLKKDEVELRKYCAKKTGNLDVARELYDFILHGRKAKQEKED